jgi:predicted hydrocarbon binding protein
LISGNSILAALKFDEARGALLYQDVRYLLIRPETLATFQKAVEEKLGAGADALLFTGGFTGGSLSAQRYREVFGLSDEQAVQFMARMGAEIGWGNITITHFDAARGELALMIDSSPFAAAYGKSERGVCHLVRGVFAGLASGIFRRAVVADEDKCVAMGHARCHIVIRVA